MWQLLTGLIGLAGGAVGYVLVTFYFQPLLRFRAIRYQVLSDLDYYANAINPEDMNEQWKKQVYKRQIANRRHSADLLALYGELPCCYRWWLKWRKVNPDIVRKELMGLSNTTDYDRAQDRVDAIRKHLGAKMPVPVKRPPVML